MISTFSSIPLTRIIWFHLSVIEAMAVGCPVLLPKVCERTFGTAAVYCEPENVWTAIQELWRDQDAYLARAQAGRDFVLANCDWTQFACRLHNCDFSLSSVKRSRPTCLFLFVLVRRYGLAIRASFPKSYIHLGSDIWIDFELEVLRPIEDAFFFI